MTLKNIALSSMKSEFSKQWLKFALDDLQAAEVLQEADMFTLAAYHLQQAVEKSLKAVVVYKIGYLSRDYKTHNISVLIECLRKEGIEIPDYVQKSEHLTDFAFTTRYPDDYVPVSKTEYEEAYQIAKRVFNWAKIMIAEDKR